MKYQFLHNCKPPLLTRIPIGSHDISFENYKTADPGIELNYTRMRFQPFVRQFCQKPLRKILVKSFFEKETNTAQYVLSCPTTKESVILDPVLDYDPNTGRTETGSADTILEYVKTENLSVKFLLETHIHADHLTSSYYLKQELSKGNTSPKTCISKNITIVQKEFAKMFELDDVACDGSQFDCLLKENDELLMGDVKIKVIETPGHTPACLSYIAEIDSDKCIFVGDTLFMVK